MTASFQIKFIAAARLARLLHKHPVTRQHPGQAVARALAWQIWKRTSKSSVVIDAFGARKLICYPDSRSASAVLYLGMPDYAEMSFLHALLTPDDVFYDVGANVGVYTLLASTRIDNPRQLVAIEPDPKNYRRLCENLAVNDISDAVHLNIALGASSGKLPYEVGNDVLGRVSAELGPLPSKHSATSIETLMRNVMVDTLDSLADQHGSPTVLKLDVEGYELQVLRGASRLLEGGTAKALLLETNATCQYYGTTRDELREYLAKYGYGLYNLSPDGSSLNPIEVGSAYPHNAVATADLAWIRGRLRTRGLV